MQIMSLPPDLRPSSAGRSLITPIVTAGSGVVNNYALEIYITTDGKISISGHTGTRPVNLSTNIYYQCTAIWQV